MMNIKQKIVTDETMRPVAVKIDFAVLLTNDSLLLTLPGLRAMSLKLR
ncbi:MAG TPA: hypothetical protein PKK23_20325 [Nitrospirales bacterium]|nr:hypothetical protein [Nitrospirales bacterium]